MNASPLTPRLIALLAVAGLSLSTASAQPEATTDPEIIREGDEERREALDEMELTPFPLENWDLVTTWSLADAPTPESTDGNVVVIMTFAGWYPPSLRSLAVINRMATERGEEGLVVVGVHDMEAWDEGLAAAESRQVAFAIGHDADNKFREALMVDQDPDFYLIDRAGQLRFADIETSSVEAAVDLLLDETRDDAATVIDRIADAALRAEIASRRTSAINRDADLTDIPEVPFAMPGPEAYTALRWPVPPRDPNNSSQPVEAIARPVALPRDGWWPEPPSPLGRATVIYFFDRRVPKTIEMISEMDDVQRLYSRDLNVVGSMSPIFQDNSGQQTTSTTPAADPVQLIRRAHERGGLVHSLVIDPTGGLLTASAGGQSVTFNSGSAGGANPTLAAIASSDGVVRWFGDATSHAFESAVREIARIDPGVRARRQAEDAYLRRRGQ